MRISQTLKCITTIMAAFAIVMLLSARNRETATDGSAHAADAPASAQSVAESGTKSSESPKRRLIIDTDTGADDASALIYAAMRKSCTIEGVTILKGNVGLEQSAQNALMALELAGSDAPVYRGADTTYDGKERTAFSVFGNDGMGDAGLIHPKASAQEGDAVDFILDTVRNNPGEIEIVLLGPATNIAHAIEKDPETMRHVKMIWSMGTTGLGPGNASPVAEFNVYHDALAYQKLLDAGLPTTIVGLDVCGGDAMWTEEQFAELKQLNDRGRFVEASFGKIRDFYAANGSTRKVMNCDTVTMACVLSPDLVDETLNCHASCMVKEDETHGQVIFYKEGFKYDGVKNDFDYNVRLVTDINESAVFDAFIGTISQ